ncbi:MAG: hypothetical protein KBS68_05925 [Clostridiales bacterium]|nr:hypothetical protein [Candidatus Crickella merdequi]
MIKKSLIIVLSAMLILVTAGVSWAAENETAEPLTVEVYCHNGSQPVSGATVVLINELTSEETSLGSTGADGIVRVVFTEAGEYALRCTCNGKVSDYLGGLEVLESDGKLMMPDGSTRIDLKAVPAEKPSDQPSNQPSGGASSGSNGSSTGAVTGPADEPADDGLVEIEETEVPKAKPTAESNNGVNVRLVVIGALGLFMIAFALMRRRD